MDKIKPGIYWIKWANACPCEYCKNHIQPAQIEIARFTDGGYWEVFGSDEGLGLYVEVTILREVEPYHG